MITRVLETIGAAGGPGILRRLVFGAEVEVEVEVLPSAGGLLLPRARY
jgi:hypothetical protein